VVFAKFPSALIGPDDAIVIPREETRPDYEGEVAVVLGRTVYRASADEARAAVGGITCLHDVSGRRAQLETPLRQFTLGKSFDTFSPMGRASRAPRTWTSSRSASAPSSRARRCRTRTRRT
jgi:2-keto-4-pentenoate hydratase/2-oxohepta-3-ene-1,7-dioic acid hydratase in catechol pathway